MRKNRRERHIGRPRKTRLRFAKPDDRPRWGQKVIIMMTMKQFEEAAKKEQKERMEGSDNTMMKETMKDTLPANKTTEKKGRTMRSPEERERLLREWREARPDEYGRPYLSDIIFEDDEDEEEEVDLLAAEAEEPVEEILEDGEKNRIPSNENACRMNDENVRRMTVYTGPTGGGKTYLLERMCNEVFLAGSCFPTDEALFAAEPNTMGFLEELLFEGQAIGVENVNLLTEKQQDLLVELLTTGMYFRNPLTGEKMFIGENFELYGTLTDGEGEIPEKILPYVNVQRVEFNAEELYKAVWIEDGES